MSSRVQLLVAMVVASVALSACGSGSSRPSERGRSSREAQANAGASGLNYARCMRSHGVSRFPDPSANGSLNTNVPGLNLSSPAGRAAESACQSLLPQKQPPSQPPTASAYARLLHWAKCMRQHGIRGLPDPKPDPLPGPKSPVASRYATVMGDGGYWVGIPPDDSAHSPAFLRLSTRCGENPISPA